jgi:hypothetical protein
MISHAVEFRFSDNHDFPPIVIIVIFLESLLIVSFSFSLYEKVNDLALALGLAQLTLS